MAKKSIKPEQPADDNQKDDLRPDYTSEEKNTNIQQPEQPADDNQKGDSYKATQFFARRKKDDAGNFLCNGLIKYYIKHATRKQIEKDDIMIFEDDGKECGFYLNITAEEEKRRRENDEIF